MPAAFYRRIDDDTYEATSATESPWDATAQHGGPATALLIAAVERELSGSGLRATSVTAEFLEAIPRGVVDVTVSVVRSGRRVQLMEATMHATDTPVRSHAAGASASTSANHDRPRNCDRAHPMASPPAPRSFPASHRRGPTGERSSGASSTAATPRPARRRCGRGPGSR
ncbi:MAG: thioesterase family protein [Actinomycetota bacterium]|nr:MAG: thioesterase family protein [Actinomycetota bacterium]